MNLFENEDLSKVANEIFDVFKSSDASSLYLSSKDYAKKHDAYYKKQAFSIDHTSQTVMNDMLAQTKLTPEEKQDEMRKKRDEAIEDFCYIYGGYIYWQLEKKWTINKYKDIKEKGELLYTATGQVLDGIIRNLKENGYKQGTFSHLIHVAICRKANDVHGKYLTRLKEDHNAEHISVDEHQDILGGYIALEETSNEDFDSIFEEERQIHYAGLTNYLRKVRVTKTHEDDLEMLIRKELENKNVKDIAKDMDLSIQTVYKRLDAFKIAAVMKYKEYLKKMEKSL